MHMFVLLSLYLFASVLAWVVLCKCQGVRTERKDLRWAMSNYMALLPGESLAWRY